MNDDLIGRRLVYSAPPLIAGDGHVITVLERTGEDTFRVECSCGIETECSGSFLQKLQAVEAA